MTEELRRALGVLRERRDWLTARIRAKQFVGWDIEWDTRERDSLSAVIAFMEALESDTLDAA